MTFLMAPMDGDTVTFLMAPGEAVGFIRYQGGVTKLGDTDRHTYIRYSHRDFFESDLIS